MPTFQPFDWYETPAYYDIIFDADTEKESVFLDAMHALYGLTTTTKRHRLLEPACGTGRLLISMAKRNWQCTGFDLSPGSLDFAKKRLEQQGHTATLHQLAMEKFDLGHHYDLAHCLVSTFKYLITETDARTHLECVAKSLKPGGIYVLGLHLTDYNLQSKQRERWVAKRDATHVVCNIQSWPPDQRKRIEQVRSRLVVTERGRVRRFESQWTFRTYSLRQLQSLLKSVPAFEHVATYDFNYSIDCPGKLDGEMLDNVLILRRK